MPLAQVKAASGQGQSDDQDERSDERRRFL